MKNPALFILCLLFSATSIADTAANALSMSVYNKLTTIERLMAQESFSKAQKKLDTLLKNIPKEAADKAYIYHSQGTLALYQESYARAEKYYLLSYQQDALDKKTAVSVVQTLANLSMHAGKYQQAVSYLQTWRRLAETPSKQMYIALGTAYYQLKQYNNVILYLEKAMSLFPPDKSIHLMLFSAYYELKNLNKAALVMEEVIKAWPEEGKYWLQLASVYLELKNYDKSLEIMQLALTRHLLLKESELLQFVYILFEKGLPYKAAVVLTDGLQGAVAEKNHKNYSLLATLFVEAREDDAALEAFKKTSEYSSDGSEELYIAQIYYDQDNFKECISHATAALDRGIKQRGNAYMLIAAAYNDLENTGKSRENLQKATHFKNTRENASQWLKLLSSED